MDLMNHIGNFWARSEGYTTSKEAEMEMFGGPDDDMTQRNRAFLRDIAIEILNWEGVKFS